MYIEIYLKMQKMFIHYTLDVYLYTHLLQQKEKKKLFKKMKNFISKLIFNFLIIATNLCCLIDQQAL